MFCYVLLCFCYVFAMLCYFLLCFCDVLLLARSVQVNDFKDLIRENNPDIGMAKAVNRLEQNIAQRSKT